MAACRIRARTPPTSSGAEADASESFSAARGVARLGMAGGISSRSSRALRGRGDSGKESVSVGMYSRC